MIAFPSKPVTLMCEKCAEPFAVERYRKDVARFCSRHCARVSQVGPRSGGWKGGHRWLDPVTGYITIWCDTSSGRRAAREHRVIAAQALGRQLTRREYVHHLNGIRHDNRTENLIVVHPETHEHNTFVRALQARIRELETRVREVA